MKERGEYGITISAYRRPGGERGPAELHGHGHVSPEGQQFAVDILDYLRDCWSRLNETGHVYVSRRRPARRTAWPGSTKPAIRTSSLPERHPYYTNSSQLPVEFTDFEALELQDELQSMIPAVRCSTLSRRHRRHRRASGWSGALTLQPPYSLTRPSASPDHGTSGRHFGCPDCGAETEVWSRVTGYLRPSTISTKARSRSTLTAASSRCREALEEWRRPPAAANEVENGPDGHRRVREAPRWPGWCVSAVVFTPGCSMNCAYCHNRSCSPARTSPHPVDGWPRCGRAGLSRWPGHLGGEPPSGGLKASSVPSAHGVSVKSTPTAPGRCRASWTRACRYVAMDVKAPTGCTRRAAARRLTRCTRASAVCQGAPFEFRTVLPHFRRGTSPTSGMPFTAPRYVLQFRPDGIKGAIPALAAPTPHNGLKRVAAELSARFPDVSTRVGVAPNTG